MEKEHKFNSALHTRKIREWQTILNELRMGNIRLKEQLSEAISHEVSPAFVEQAEEFQQRFVEKDQVMDLLRQDINGLRDSLSADGITDAHEKQFQLLEKDLEKFIFEFQRMKVFFSNFLSTK